MKRLVILFAMAFLWNAMPVLTQIQNSPFPVWEYQTGLESEGGKIFALAANEKGDIIYAAKKTGILVVTRVTPSRAVERFVELGSKIDKIYLRNPNIYLLTEGKIAKANLDLDNITFLPIGANMSITEMDVDAQGTIWAVTSGWNAFSLTANSREWVRQDSVRWVNHVLVDGNDNVWFGTFEPNQGVFVRSADGKWMKIPLWNKQRKCYEYPSISMASDNENVYVVGSTYNYRQVIYILPIGQPGQYNDDIMPGGLKSIQIDRNGTLWAMEAQGVLCWYPRERNNGWHSLLMSGWTPCNDDLVASNENIYCSVFGASVLPYKIQGYQFNITGVPETPASKPATFRLEQNFPNPFNSSTMISYSLQKPSLVKLSVFNSLGREVAILVDEKQGIGEHRFVWNANKLPSGTYILRLSTENSTLTRKVLLLR